MTAKSTFFNILQSLCVCVLCVYLGVCLCVRGQVCVHMDASSHFAPRLRKGLLFTAASTRLAGLCVSEECVIFASHFIDKNAGVADHVAMLVEQVFLTPHLSNPFLLYGKSLSVNTQRRGGLRC